MRLLLDTHTFIWWCTGHERLSQQAYSQCLDTANTLVFSTASAWEMQIKIQLGKLQLDNSIVEMVREQERTNRLEVLSVTLEHVYNLSKLPRHHSDPFDRMLLAQALTEPIPIISADEKFEPYSVRVIW